MLKAVSQALGLGVAVAAIMEPVQADGPLPCWPYCIPAPDDPSYDCYVAYGSGWHYCGPAGPGYVWCCPT